MDTVKRAFITACQSLTPQFALKSMRRQGAPLWAFLWTLPMQIAAGWVRLFLEPKVRTSMFVGQCRVRVIHGPHGRGLSIANDIYLWLDPSKKTIDEGWLKDLITHEVGHWEQAKRVGPLWPLIYGVPSLLWASMPMFRRWRQQKHVSYYHLYTEKSADRLGSKALGHLIRRT